MSRIADRIRAYVNDYSVSEHFGAWGILRPDQRRLIRELCDTCDMFEKTADALARKQSEIIKCKNCNNHVEDQIEEMAKDICESYNDDGTCYCDNKPCDLKCECFTDAQYFYEKGYRKQEWISVDERLPEESGEYITLHEHGSCGVIYYNASIHLWNVYYFDDVRNAIRSITHWMPLPEAPKMKGGAE